MGNDNFRNEITWKRTFAHGNVGRNYPSLNLLTRFVLSAFMGVHLRFPG
jgi:hypothetical protein